MSSKRANSCQKTLPTLKHSQMADDDVEYVYSDDEGAPDSPPQRRAASGAPAVSTSAPGGGARTGVDYRRLAPEEIKLEQDKVVRDVATILDVPPECAHTLLILFK